MSLKLIQKNIKTIVVNAAKLNVLIHETGLLIIGHAIEHGDCSPAKDLVNAMPASMRRTMLKAWFERFSPIRFNMSEGLAVKVGMLKPEAKTYTPFDVPGGEATPFFQIAEENPEKTYDFAALLKLVERLPALIEKKIEGGKVPAEDILSAQAMAVKLSALKFDRVFANDDAKAPVVPIQAAA